MSQNISNKLKNNDLSFFGDPSVKEDFVFRAKKYRELETLVPDNKDRVSWLIVAQSAIFRTLVATGSRQEFSKMLGLPEWLGLLEDKIFYFLPPEEAQRFPEEVIEAIPVGINKEKFEKLKNRFMGFCLYRQFRHWGIKVNPPAVNNMISSIQFRLESGATPDIQRWEEFKNSDSFLLFKKSVKESSQIIDAVDFSLNGDPVGLCIKNIKTSCDESENFHRRQLKQDNEAKIQRDWLLHELEKLVPQEG